MMSRSNSGDFNELPVTDFQNHDPEALIYVSNMSIQEAESRFS